MAAALPLEALITYADEESRKWQEFFDSYPSAMELKTDIAHTQNVRGLLIHIFAVDDAYTHRIMGEAVDFQKVMERTQPDPFKVGAEARQFFRDKLSKWDDAALDEQVTFGTLTSGQQTASRRKMLVHTLLHGIRHWAQLATLVRQHGYNDPGKHDFLFSSGIK